MKTKAVALVILVLTGAFIGTIGLRIRRGREAATTSSLPLSSVGRPIVPPAPTTPKSAAQTLHSPEEPVETFVSYGKFWTAFRKAFELPEDGERWRAMRRLGLRRSDVQFERAVARVKGKRAAWSSAGDALRNILGDWMRHEGPDAAAFLGRLSPGGSVGDGHAWTTIAEDVVAWAAEDPKAALVFLKFLPDDWELSALIRKLGLQIRHRSDPDAFLAWVRTLPSGDERNEAMLIAMPGWSAANPQAAAEWVERLPVEVRASALRTIAEAWARSNFPAALRWARTYIDATGDVSPNRTNVLMGLLFGAVETNPAWALEMARTWETNSFTPFYEVLARWASRDLDGAARFVETSDLDALRRSHAAHYVALRLGAADPEAALKWLEGVPQQQDGLRNHQAVQMIFLDLALLESSDPLELLRRIDKLPEWARPAATEGLVSGWARYDPPAAARFIQTLPSHHQSQDLVRQVASQWAQEDSAAALSWVRAWTSDAVRDEGLEALLYGVATQSVDRAISIAGEISDPDKKWFALQDAITDGAPHDPAAAAAALGRLPHLNLMTYCVVGSWFGLKDPEAGLAWALSLPENYEEHPPNAAAGDRFPEQPLRLNVLEAVVKGWAWKGRNKEAAAQWIAGAALSKAAKDRLLAAARE